MSVSPRLIRLRGEIEVVLVSTMVHGPDSHLGTSGPASEPTGGEMSLEYFDCRSGYFRKLSQSVWR